MLLTLVLWCSWYPWGFDSCKFVEVWRYFVEIVRARTCRTVFMWAPAEAGGYPFNGMTPPSPPPTSLNRRNSPVVFGTMCLLMY